MSDQTDWFSQFAPIEEPEEPAPTGGETSWFDQFQAEPQELDRSPIGAATRDRRYQQILQALYMAEWATTNPEIGDIEELSDTLTYLLEDLATAYDVPQMVLRERAQGDLRGYVEAQGGTLPLPKWAERGLNTLGTIGGIFEPTQLAPDFAMTFTSNLAKVQGEREARNDMLETGEITDPSDPRYYQGAPASNPWQALTEIATAAGRTFTQLQLDEASGWVTYFPSLTLGGERIFGTSPYEEGRATRGADLIRQFGLYENLNIDPDDELSMELWGLAFEVAMDPYLFADVVNAGAKMTRLLSRATGSPALARGATSLERTARHINRTISPIGIIGDVDKLTSGITFGYWDDLKAMVGRGLNSFLDADAPEWFLSGRVRSAMGMLGPPPEGAANASYMGPKWRDVFGQSGTFAYLPGPLPKWLTGGEDYGLSAPELALGYRNQIRDIGVRSVTQIATYLTDGLPRKRSGFRLPWARISIPGVRAVTDEYQGYVRGLNMAVRDWLDGASLYDDVRHNAKMMERLQGLSTAYNLPIDGTLSRFEGAVRTGRQAILQVGYEVSGYRYYVEAMRRAANELGYDFNDVRRAGEGVWQGVLDERGDLQTLEALGLFPTVKRDPTTGMPVTGATAADPAAMARAQDIWDQWGRDPDAYTEWVNTVNRHLAAMGRNTLHGITPERYLQGIQEGYLRRSFMGTREPRQALESVMVNPNTGVRATMPLRESEIPDTVSIIRGELGDAAGDAARAFFVGMTPMIPRGQPADAANALVFRAEDLARTLTARTGNRVTAAQVTEMVARHDPNSNYFRETVSLLDRYNVIQPEPGVGGSMWGQVPSTYQGRQDLNPERLASLIQYDDATRQVVEMASRGGRQVSAQEFLGMAWDQLNADGLVLSRDAIRPGAVADINAPARPYEVNGVAYVGFPDNPAVWGPFADQAVPYDVARTMVQALAFQETGATQYERFLRLWRQQLISPLPTSIRNIIGNMLVIQQGGGDMTGMVVNLPRAIKFRAHFLETGRLPDEFAGYEHMFQFVQSSTQTAAATGELGRLLEDVGRGTRTFDDILTWAENAVQAVTNNPNKVVATGITAATLGGTGALGLFKFGEEVTRTAAFLTTYDTLMSQGIEHAEAVSRAAHFATNAAYNYGALPLGPELLRRSGLSAFPQFAYFTAGRTVRVMAENPAAPRRFEHLRRLLNTISTEGDLSEQEILTAWMANWQQHAHPGAVPIPDENNMYYVFDGQYWLPQGANVAEVFLDPFSLPAVAPLFDAAYALNEGNTGTGPLSVRFGDRVFDPAEDTAGRLADTAQFLLQSYMFPGVWRQYERVGESARYEGLPFGVMGLDGRDREMMDIIALSQYRYVNSDWTQFFARTFGLNFRKTSTDIAGASLQRAVRAVDTEMGPAISSARQAWQALLVRPSRGPDHPETQQAYERYMEWNVRAMERVQELLNAGNRED